MIRVRPQAESPTQEVLAGLVERVTYHNEENGFCVLRIKASMRRANVPDDAINQVVEDQTNTFTFSGYVTTITYDDQRTEVQFGGEGGLILHFPPNPSKYLPEIIRAQSHPHLAVFIVAKNSPQEPSPQIVSFTVGLDYPYPWPNNRPPFDVRTLSAPQNTTLTTTTTTAPSSA